MARRSSSRTSGARKAPAAKTPAGKAQATRTAPPPVEPTPTDSWRLALSVTVGLTLLRLFALRLSPLQLYIDEAQYWVWSRHLAFGYFSKPPMVAWIIAATTRAFGDSESVVRMSSPLLHAAAGLFVYGAGRKLYDQWTGFVALLVYALAPAVQLGSFVVSTDTPLCCGLAAALWLYVVLQTAEGRTRLLAAAGFGLALGLAFLAKYAAIYALIGVALHLAISREARRAWTWQAAVLAVLAFALAAGPNLAWNAAHGFTTIANTAADAAWNYQQRFNLLSLGSFLLAQLGVFGPAPFLLLIVGGALLAWRRGLLPADLLLLAWAAPPLLIISVQAFIVRANPNWAVAAYVPASVLVAAWLLRWRARRWTAAILASQAVVALVVLAGVVNPTLADRVGASHAFRDVRGWRELTEVLKARAEVEALAGPVSAVAVDSRYLFNEASYYGRDYFGAGGPPLRIWVSGRTPQNEAEASAPLTPALGARVVAGSDGGGATAAMMRDFAQAGAVQINTLGLDRRHSRRLDTFVGLGFQPKR